MRGLPPYCEHVNAMYVPRSWQRASVVHSTQTLSATEQTPVSQSLDDMQATQVFVATSHTGRSLSVQSAEDEQNTHLPRLHEVLPSALFCERARHVKSRSFPSSRRHARIVQQPARERDPGARDGRRTAHMSSDQQSIRISFPNLSKYLPIAFVKNPRSASVASVASMSSMSYLTSCSSTLKVNPGNKSPLDVAYTSSNDFSNESEYSAPEYDDAEARVTSDAVAETVVDEHEPTLTSTRGAHSSVRPRTPVDTRTMDGLGIQKIPNIQRNIREISEVGIACREKDASR